MAITRRLPNSDETRDRALTTAKTKNDSVPRASQIITAFTKGRLNVIQPQFKTRMQARANALAAQSGSTGTTTEAFDKTYGFVSSWFQVFNLGIKRGKYQKSERAFLGIDINSEAIPVMTTEEQLTQWGQRVKDGDAARVAAGGAPMENPTTAEVDAEVTTFNTENTSQSTLKDAYDNAQEAVAALHTEADGVIKKVWDEVETFYNEETPSSKRANARAYGVVYVSTVKLTFNLMARNAAGQAPLAGVICRLVETGNEQTTAANGTAIMESNIADEATFHFIHPDFITQEVVVTLTQGQTVFDVTVDLVHV